MVLLSDSYKFWLSVTVSHQTDGLFGGLIVNQPVFLEPYSSLYDYDRTDQSTIMVSASFPKLFTGNLEDLSKIKPTSLYVNGEEIFK